MYIWVCVLSYDVESISYWRSWCKTMVEVSALQSPGWSSPYLPPHRHLIHAPLMSLWLSLTDLIQILNHAVLTYTKGLPTCCSFCGDSPVPRFTPTVSQTSHESTFPRETCWDLLTSSNPSSHALIIQSTLSSWLWFHIIHVIICLFLQSSTKATEYGTCPFLFHLSLSHVYVFFYYRIRRQ